ncbi:MAG: methylmalonyl-CoA mutase family protein [Salinivirgaceae bacterium]|jgi:methylmalonyl-CoA mutase|nr:methylmalonyl-CoA mutase family protein [Salinivirgaceae bacterium]
MSEMEKDKYLFEEFPPISKQEWEDKIITDLKGADYDRKLIWRTNEGINVRPYYRAEDLEKIDYLNVNPNEFPFIRGVNIKKNQWFIRQDIEVIDYATANNKALELLTKGVDSLGFIIGRDKGCSKEDLTTLLKDIPVADIEINIIAGHGAMDIAKLLNEIEIDQSITGSFAFDPLMCVAKTGKFKNDNPIADAATVINLLKDFPNFKAITIWGDLFENAGSSIVQELGYSLSVANEYMAGLTEAGITAEDAAKAIKFNYATGSNYFMEIAKVRAARLLWAKIVEQYTQDNNAALANIHAVTSDWNKTIYDPYANMLRTQTEAMSSILGGVNSMTVKGFNAVYEKPTDFSNRIARNQQILLKEESHFDKVVDPGAGSYYIESLTDSIAEQAWKLFLEVEDKGGFVAAFKEGSIQASIKDLANKRDLDIANRKENFLGVNQFPNFTESIEAELDAELFERKCCEDYCDCKNEDCDCDAEPLIPYRGAMAIEAMRYKTDVFAKNNKRPLAFMLTIGNLTMRKARAQFACNFFAVAGCSVQDNNGFETIAEGIKAAKEAKADIVVLCSSDDEYSTYAPEVMAQVGDAITVVAGFPKAIMDDLKAKGIEHFVHVKSNLIETLTGFQKELGIE